MSVYQSAPAVDPPWLSRCVCGHLESAHQSSGARGLRVRFGVCLREGCECREFQGARS